MINDKIIFMQIYIIDCTNHIIINLSQCCILLVTKVSESDFSAESCKFGPR